MNAVTWRLRTHKLIDYNYNSDFSLILLGCDAIYMDKDFWTGSAVTADPTRGLTPCGSVCGSVQWWPGHPICISYTEIRLNEAVCNPRNEEKGCTQVRTCKSVYRQAAPLGVLQKPGETMRQLEPSGGFLLVLLDFVSLSMGQQWQAVPRLLALGGGAALAVQGQTLLWKLSLEPDWVLWHPCPSPRSHWAAYTYGETREGRADVPQPHGLARVGEQRKSPGEGDTKSWRFWNTFPRTEKGAQGVCGKALTHPQMEMFGESQQFPLDLPTESGLAFCFLLHVYSIFIILLLV